MEYQTVNLPQLKEIPILETQTQSGKVRLPGHSPTGRTIHGEQILEYRKHGKLGHRCIVETKPGCPVFEIKSGREVGLKELQDFIGMDGVKPLTEKRRGNWTYKDRDAIARVKYVAVSDYKTHNPYSKTGAMRDPEAQVWVELKNGGIEQMTNADLRRVLGEASADGRVEKLCADNGFTPPHLKKPETVLKKPTKQDRERVSRTENSSSDANDASGLSPKRNEATLESLLAKMDQRMDNMEKKFEKVDKLEAMVTPLASIVEGLVKQTGFKFDQPGQTSA